MTTIRPAISADIDSLIALLKILFSIEEDFKFEPQMQRHGLEMLLANPQGCILVAENSEGVIGMCTGQLTISTAEGGPAALIEDIVVSEKYRRQGLGKLLLKRVSNWARTKNVSRLQLLADQNNEAALDFYKSIGWQKTQLICLRKHISWLHNQEPWTTAIFF